MWRLVLFLLASTDDDPVLAVVEGHEIRRSAFEQAAARATAADGVALSNAEKREVLQRLVDEHLLYLDALDRGLDRDPKVMKVMVNTLLRDEIYSGVKNADFSREELEAYYNAHRAEFVVPEKVQVKRILLTNNDRSDAEARALAESLRAQLSANPEAFKDLAIQHSEDPYRRRGGDIGFVPPEGKAGLDPAVVERAFALPVGVVSPVFQTDQGYNLVMVADRRESVERSFEQMQGSVLRKVKNDRLRDVYEAYVAKRRAGARVTVDAAALGAIEVKHYRSPLLPGGDAELDEGSQFETDPDDGQ